MVPIKQREEICVPCSTSSQRPVRRQVKKRSGPPQLQFLTATDLSQFKDEKIKKSVRSQAMLQYRYRSEQQKHKENKAGDVGRMPELDNIKQNLATRAYHWHDVSALQVAPVATMQNRIQNHVQGQERFYTRPPAAWLAFNPEDNPRDPYFIPPSSAYLTQSSRYRRALLTLDGFCIRMKRVVEYEDSDQHREVIMHIIRTGVAAACLRSVRNGSEPFSVLPQFSSPKVNTLDLFRECSRHFITPTTMRRWGVLVFSDPDVMPTGTLLTCGYLDMHSGYSGDSARTLRVKSETIRKINNRLRNPATQLDDLTLASILHLLMAELWSCDEKTLRIHEAGAARLIAQKGGMHALGGNGVVAEVACGVSYQMNIICQAQPPPILFNYSPAQVCPVSPTALLPESPLYCPRSQFFTLLQSDMCSEFTYEILCDMRDLTDLFLSCHNRPDPVEDMEDLEPRSHSTPDLAQYEKQVSEIQARLFAMPSAYTSGLPLSNDWVYESCRITGLIYTTAIVFRIPFYIAADRVRASVLYRPFPAIYPFDHEAPRLTEILYQTLEKTNLNDIWKSMAGVLYWITAVGAAAARTPQTLKITHALQCRGDAYAIWVRRCLIMFSARTMIILLFDHPRPVLGMMKKLLRVQKLVENYG
ncbi:hypothetical protein GQ43DRAFT_301310 [Delitschia confertaspora ATCC 74209]|uniref:Transcription factor domain-containing protein n=1 Tax=Delitschia confertaspora ATCC 74209 TaxID=1513339 RepID=A0A9P4MRA0_9PLEO|nr:hypothetical protein GQ43DRAFT_301310 [Delitschia confertaspora ATCC 74209]